jgi:hypothetical protein
MTIQFVGTQGPAADEAELQYMAALLQTGTTANDLRIDGTIQAIDLYYYFISRHGLLITMPQRCPTPTTPMDVTATTPDKATETIAANAAAVTVEKDTNYHLTTQRVEQVILQELAGSVRRTTSSTTTSTSKISSSSTFTNNESSFHPSSSEKDRSNHPVTSDNNNNEDIDDRIITDDDLNLDLFGSDFDLLEIDKPPPPPPLAMDLVQLMALLFIPEVVRIRNDYDMEDDNVDNSKGKGLSSPSAVVHGNSTEPEQETMEKQLRNHGNPENDLEHQPPKTTINDDENEEEEDGDDLPATANDTERRRESSSSSPWYQVIGNVLLGSSSGGSDNQHRDNSGVELSAIQEDSMNGDTNTNNTAEEPKFVDEPATTDVLQSAAQQQGNTPEQVEIDNETYRPINKLGIVDMDNVNCESTTAPKEEALAVFRVILNTILHTSQIEYGTELSVERLHVILKAHGEEWPDDIVQEMIEACRDSEQKEPQDEEAPLVLNVHAFMRGLTNDVMKHYDVEREDYLTTHYQDALSKPGEPLERMYTAPSCDSTADTYRSFWWNVLAWATLVAVFFAYFVRGFGAVKRSMPGFDCAGAEISEFGCHVIEGIIIWLEIFLELSFLGTTFLFFATWGNSVYAFLDSRWYAALTDIGGIVVVFFVTVLSYVEEIDTPLFNTEKEEDENSKSRYWYALILGSILLATQCIQLIRLFIPLHPQLKSFMVPGALVRERWIKQSASFKIRRMFERALGCHLEEMPSIGESQNLYTLCTLLLKEKARISIAHILLNFQTKNEETKPMGGIFWVWKCILNHHLMKEEGIWISPTLVSSQIGQWLVVLAVPFFFVYALKSIDEWNIFEPDVKNGE